MGSTLYSVVVGSKTKFETYFPHLATDEAERLMLEGHNVTIEQAEGNEEDAKAEAIRRLTELVEEVATA